MGQKPKSKDQSQRDYIVTKIHQAPVLHQKRPLNAEHGKTVKISSSSVRFQEVE